MRKRNWFLVLLASLFLIASAGAAPVAPYACEICGEPISDRIYTVVDQLTSEKKQVCFTCVTWPKICFVCGLAARKEPMELSDGRVLCARDAKTAVLDEKEALEICAEVRDSLDRLFARFITFPGTNMVVDVVDRVNLLELFKLPGNDLSCPNALGYTRFKSPEDELSFHVSIMSALPRTTFKAVCAHEYTHCWVRANVPAARRKQIGRSAEEGFCELIAYLLMDSQREEQEKGLILRNPYSRGQIDLFIDVEKRHGFNMVVEWVKYGVDPLLKKEDLDRVRNVEIPAPETKPADSSGTTLLTANPTQPALAPAAPDTLVLSGISWVKSKPLALINNRTFGIGESGKVPLGKTNVAIRCLAIQPDSARIEIIGSGKQQELRLKTK